MDQFPPAPRPMRPRCQGRSAAARSSRPRPNKRRAEVAHPPVEHRPADVADRRRRWLVADQRRIGADRQCLCQMDKVSVAAEVRTITSCRA